MSNLFKTVTMPSNPNEFVVQYPLVLNNAWTIICVDIEKVMESSSLYPETFEIKGSHILKSFTLNSTLNVRGVFTSDNLYQWHNLPSEIAFKAPAGSNRGEWEAQFNWVTYPSLDEEFAKS